MIFIALTLCNIRSLIVRAIPECLKRATAAGIGFFIAYIALSSAGIIVASEATKTTLGDFNQPSMLVAITGTGLTQIYR